MTFSSSHLMDSFPGIVVDLDPEQRNLFEQPVELNDFRLFENLDRIDESKDVKEPGRGDYEKQDSESLQN